MNISPCLLLSLTLVAPGASAAVVTLCQTYDQPAPPGAYSLLKAVQEGGLVTFQCGTATIVVTHPIDVVRDVEIEGAGLITLDAQNTSRMFAVSAQGVHLKLNHLVLRRGKVPSMAAHGGSLVYTFYASFITLSGSKLRDSQDPLFVAGGATLTIDRSEISANTGTFLQTQPLHTSPTTTITVTDTDIFDNDGAVLWGNCALNISRSYFRGNRGRSGGAFESGCATTIDHSHFSNNRARENGGAIYFDTDAAVISLRATTFSGNSAAGLGGAIAVQPSGVGANGGHPPARTLQIRYGEFTGNHGRSGGALNLGNYISNNVTLDAGVILFERNIATDDGGAISGTSALWIHRGVFRDNQASARGGGISLTLYAPRPGLLANSLMVRNQAPIGAAISGSGVRIVNSTIAENAGPALSYFFGGPAQQLHKITFINSVLFANTGGNCSPPGNAYFDGGHNLQFPGGSCGPIPISTPLLDPSYAPLIGGAAFAKGDAATCATPEVSAQDVWGQRRPRMGYNCSIGAVEGEILQSLERRQRSREPRR